SHNAKGRFWTWAARAIFGGLSMLVAYGTIRLAYTLLQVPGKTWMQLLAGTGLTLVRVIACLILGSIWTVPVGIWIGTSQRRIRVAQPLVQVLASFPAPMLYPLALSVMFVLHIPFGFGAMFLMLLGVQWYILFNVLAGAMRIPVELKYAVLLMDVPNTELWKKL